MSCSLPVLAPVGYQIEVNVLFVDTERGYDVLSVYSGLSVRSKALVRAFSGEEASKQTFVVDNNQALITFRSDESESGEGFMVVVYFRQKGLP